MKAEDLISVADYAKAHGKSLSWAYKQITKKKVKKHMIGKTVFIIVGKEAKGGNTKKS